MENSKFNHEFSIQPDGEGFMVTGWWADRLAYTAGSNDDVQVYFLKFSLK